MIAGRHVGWMAGTFQFSAHLTWRSTVVVFIFRFLQPLLQN